MSEPEGVPRTEAVVLARDYRTGDRLRVGIVGGEISAIEAQVTPRDAERDADPSLEAWVAPAFWDLQVNGRRGISFSDGDLTERAVSRIVREQATMGVSRFCPTLITASREALLHGVQAIAAACDADPEVERRVLGIHLEGPWISPEDGYRGAHPREHVRAPSWEEFEAIQRASGSRIVLVTLAPEWPGSCEFIARLQEAGVVPAIGHSAADFPAIDRACSAGLRLATHLGNGVPALLPRHPNAIWCQAGHDGLWASFIADGHHVDSITLGALVRTKTIGRSILVSDASPLAGSARGRYGPWEVRDDGRIVVAGTPYLAGSNLALMEALGTFVRATGATLAEAIDCVTLRPSRLLDRMPPMLEPGQPADLILFRREDPASGTALVLLATCVGGEWTLPETSH